MHRYTETTDRMAHRLADLSIDRLAMQAPLDCSFSPDDLGRLAGQTVTPAGIGFEEAARLWEEILAPACISTDHPRNLAFIPSAPSKAAAAFDMLVGASSVYAGSWLEGSGAVYAEQQALRWIIELTGMPGTSGGVFVQGGTNGNLSALVAARFDAKRRRGGRPPRWSVLLTAETHSSVKNSLEMVLDVDTFSIPGDDRGRLTGAAVREWVASATEEERDSVFAIVATAGSTNLGVVDDIAGLADVAGEQGWWLHVDGAYGGAGLAAPSVRHLYDGIERADSFIVDPHKWLFAPFDCCALIYRDPHTARAAHTQHADYLAPITLETDWNPSDFAMQLSRRARGLPFWFSLATHGTDAYRDAVEHTIEVAREGRQLIDKAEHLRLLVEPDLSVVVFERIGWNAPDYQAWTDKNLSEGLAFVTPTKHRGHPCTRFAIVNPETTVDDLRTIIQTMA